MVRLLADTLIGLREVEAPTLLHAQGKGLQHKQLCEPGQQSKLGVKFDIKVCVYGSINPRQDEACLHPFSNGAEDKRLPCRCYVAPAHPVS